MDPHPRPPRPCSSPFAIALIVATASRLLACDSNTPLGGVGASCGDTRDCLGGLVCALGMCVEACVVDDDCTLRTDICQDGACLDPALANCGNDDLDAGESCDDGNRTDGDGCSSRCRVEGSGCTSHTECVPPLTTPPGCAEGVCDTSQGVCSFVSRDGDADGHRAASCVDALAQLAITTGDDCDDNNPARYLGAWDGPAAGTDPDRCDGVDNDCDSTADDDTTPVSGGVTSCTCTSGDNLECSEDSLGTITWPGGAPSGACSYGARTCDSSGAWGVCAGAVRPASADGCGATDDQTCDGTPHNGAIPNGVCDCLDGESRGCACGGNELCGAGAWGACSTQPPHCPPTWGGVCDYVETEGNFQWTDTQFSPGNLGMQTFTLNATRHGFAATIRFTPRNVSSSPASCNAPGSYNQAILDCGSSDWNISGNHFQNANELSFALPDGATSCTLTYGPDGWRSVTQNLGPCTKAFDNVRFTMGTATPQCTW